MIASGSENGDLIIRAAFHPYEILHQLRTGQPENESEDEPENNHKKITAIAFNPDNQSMAAASGDNKIRIWHLNDNTIQKVLTGHTDNIRPLSYSADGTKLVSGSADTSIIMWDPTEGTIVQKIILGNDQLDYPIFVKSVLLSSNGDMLIAALSDHSIRFWNTQDHTEICAMGTQGCGQPRSLALSSDGRILAAGCLYALFTWKLPSAEAADLPYLQFELIKKAARYHNDLKNNDAQLPITDEETWHVYNRLPKMFKSANLFYIEPSLQAKMHAQEEEELLKKAEFCWAEEKPFELTTIKEYEIYKRLPKSYQYTTKPNGDFLNTSLPLKGYLTLSTYEKKLIKFVYNEKVYSHHIRTRTNLL